MNQGRPKTTLLDTLRVHFVPTVDADVDVEALVVDHLRHQRKDLELIYQGQAKPAFAFRRHVSPDILEHLIREAFPNCKVPRLGAIVEGGTAMTLEQLCYALDTDRPLLRIEVVERRVGAASTPRPPYPDLPYQDTLLHRLVPYVAGLDQPTQAALWQMLLHNLVHGPLADLNFFADHALGFAFPTPASRSLLDVLAASAAARRMPPSMAGDALMQTLREHRKEFTLVHKGVSKKIFLFPRTTTPRVLEYLCREAHGGVAGIVQLAVDARALASARVIEALNTTDPVTVHMTTAPGWRGHVFRPVRLVGYDPAKDATLLRFVPDFDKMVAQDPRLAAALAQVVIHTLGAVMIRLRRQADATARLVARMEMTLG